MLRDLTLLELSSPSSLSATADSDPDPVHVDKPGEHPQTCWWHPETYKACKSPNILSSRCNRHLNRHNLYTSSLQPWRTVSETPQVRKSSILIIEHTYSRSVHQNLDSHGTRPCLVPLIIPTPPADHRELPAANAMPSGPPSILQMPSPVYPSPLAATTPFAASPAPQTAHLGPPKLAIPSATSSTALRAPTTHFPTSMKM